jgi:phosphoribosylanthranilate isomerase
LAISFCEVSDFLLLDTYDSEKINFGCTGKVHNWKISKRIVEATSIPIILAGGLSPENVASAIKMVQPAGVDSKTKTDIPGSHRKDIQAVKEFVSISKSILRD